MVDGIAQAVKDGPAANVCASGTIVGSPGLVR
jgi:hypothetical protein